MALNKRSQILPPRKALIVRWSQHLTTCQLGGVGYDKHQSWSEKRAVGMWSWAEVGLKVLPSKEQEEMKMKPHTRPEPSQVMQTAQVFVLERSPCQSWENLEAKKDPSLCFHLSQQILKQKQDAKVRGMHVLCSPEQASQQERNLHTKLNSGSISTSHRNRHEMVPFPHPPPTSIQKKLALTEEVKLKWNWH